MTIRHLRPTRRDLGPPRLDALWRAALFVGAMLAASYAVGWLVGLITG